MGAPDEKNRRWRADENGAHCANVAATFPDESFAVLQCSMAYSG
jgi:hypothetical protein